MPKKTKANGFFIFLMEYKNRHGKKFKNMQDASEEAGIHWKNMSPEQKAPYNDKAKGINSQTTKLTSEGLDVEILEKEEIEKEKFYINMREDIQDRINKSEFNNSLEVDMYYIIHVNLFCICRTNGRIYPAEIGICGFNLKDGVIDDNVFHSEIRPGKLPLGYTASADLHAKETHQLDCFSLENENDNQIEIFGKMLTFLQQRREGTRLPILYAPEKNYDIIKNLLEQWCDDFGYSVDMLRVYNLQYMFRSLKNQCAGTVTWASDTFSSREIEKDVYCFAPKIACEYHEVSDVFTYCSRSIVVRYAYIICDNCAPLRNIRLLAGRHVPQNSKIEDAVPANKEQQFTKVTRKPFSKAKGSKQESDYSESDYGATDTTFKMQDTSSIASSSINMSTFDSIKKESNFHADNDSWTDSSMPHATQISSQKNSSGTSWYGRPPVPLTYKSVVSSEDSFLADQGPSDVNFPPLGKFSKGRGQIVRDILSRTRGRGRGTNSVSSKTGPSQ